MTLTTITLKNPQRFPAGVTITPYLRSNWPTSKPPVDGDTGPVGSSAASGVAVASDGTCALTGLTAKGTYYGAAQVGGVWTYVAFTVGDLGDLSPIADVATLAASETYTNESAVLLDGSNVQVIDGGEGMTFYIGLGDGSGAADFIAYQTDDGSAGAYLSKTHIGIFDADSYLDLGMDAQGGAFHLDGVGGWLIRPDGLVVLDAAGAHVAALVADHFTLTTAPGGAATSAAGEIRGYALADSDGVTRLFVADSGGVKRAALFESDILRPPNTQTDSYTLVLADAHKAVEINKATGTTLTIPTNASVAFPIGTVIEVCQIGAGQITIAPVSGTVTIDSPSGHLKVTGQYSTVRLRKRATNEWVASGDLSA